GYGTTAKDYYTRIYAAERSGNKAAADEMKEYLINNSTAKDPEKTVSDAVRKMYENDDSLTGPEKIQVKIDAGQSVTTIKTWITNNYKDIYIAADTDGRRQLMNELTKMYKLLGISGEDAMKIVTKWVKDSKK
ncbi:MAG: hypothetical protein J6Y48_06615, partial [Clostridia bacterium]|nr:hypothetical protein [Clostridia bacterium]